MSVYKIEEITDIIRPIAEEYKIDRVCLFGSYARGEATEKSDIDLIVGEGDFKGIKFFGLYEDLIEAFQKKVDLVTEAQLNRSRGNPLYQRFIEELEIDRRVIYKC